MTALPPSPPDDQHPEVLHEIARQFGFREFSAALSSWLGFCLLAYAVPNTVPTERVLGWLGCHVLLEVLNLAQSWHLKQKQSTIDDALRRRLLRNLTITITLDGLTWGMAPFVLAVPGSETVYPMLYVLFLTCACAISLQGLCMHPPAMMGFMFSIILPMATYHLTSSDGLMFVLGLGSVLVLVLSLFYGIISWRANRQAIVTAFQNRRLAETLENRNAELHKAISTIAELASRDPLTDCLNRRALLETITTEMARHDRQGLPVGFVLIDLDHFKRINDQYGHLAGDDVLRITAQRVKHALRDHDHIARYGGEEFACVLTVQDERELMQIAERVRKSLCASPFLLDEGRHLIQVTASLGVALRQPGEGMNALARRTDQALYEAKAHGRNRIALADAHHRTPSTES